jgi:hypothetical protein
MEKINTYIAQARAAGQADEQIRQSLLSSGWQAEQITQALGPQTLQSEAPAPVSGGRVIPGGFRPPALPESQIINPSQARYSAFPADSSAQPVAASTSPPEKQRSKLLAVIIIVAVAVLLIAGGASYALFFHKVSYNTVAEEFVTAIEKGDKAKADSLISADGKAQLKKYTGSSSYYDTCKKAGATECTYYYSAAFLNKAARSTKNEGKKNGVQKWQVTYTLKQLSNTKEGSGCTSSGSSTQTLTIELAAKGNTWVVDNADPEVNFSSNLCPVNSSTTTTDPSSSDDTSDSSDATVDLPSVSGGN